MDFEEFEVDIERAIEDSKPSNSCTFSEALNWIDSTWYAPASRNARWMDIVGDYAGAEPFVIDGTRFTCRLTFKLAHLRPRALLAPSCA
jgi:hypothetical protein